MKHPSTLLVLIVLLASPLAAQADPPSQRVEARIDWFDSSLTLTIHQDLAASNRPLPVLRLEAEQAIRRNLGVILLETLGPLALDSASTAGELAAADPALSARLRALDSEVLRLSVSLDAELNAVVAQYRLSFFPALSAIFIDHTRPVPLPSFVEWVPSSGYSGLVIHAVSDLPVIGENRNAAVRPALFLTIYDEDMNVIVERRMMLPESLNRWGMSAYVTAPDDPVVAERAGATPLLTMARAVFGRNRCDLVIPRDAARRLLADPRSRTALTEGRIVVICPIE